jgi:hypothetical protein
MTIDDLEMLLATYKKDKSRFDDVVKVLVEIGNCETRDARSQT